MSPVATNLVYGMKFAVQTFDYYSLWNNTFPSSSGWNETFYLTIYHAIVSGGNVTKGSVVFSIEKTFNIIWRPEPSPVCGVNLRWDDNGVCRSGISFTLTMDWSDDPVPLPASFIFSIGFDTISNGPHPIGSNGPWDTLSLGVTFFSPTVGENLAPGIVFVNSSSGSSYADGGVGGTNILRTDTGYSGYLPLAQFLNASCLTEEIVNTNTTTGNMIVGPYNSTGEILGMMFGTLGTVFLLVALLGRLV